MLSGLHTSVTFVPCSQQSSGGFLTLRIFFSSVAQPRLLFCEVSHFTVNHSLTGPEMGSLEKMPSHP